MSFDRKMAILLCTIGIGVVAYFLVIGPYLNRGEGDPYFVFSEVSINATTNSSVIHLEDKDIMNIRGLEVNQENGKIARIYIRYSNGVPAINDQEFSQKYGSSPYDSPSTRKYLEYKGVYYYAVFYIP